MLNHAKRWANIANWSLGILMSIATPATAIHYQTPSGHAASCVSPDGTVSAQSKRHAVAAAPR
jgi:hypothetical protein